MTRLLGLMLLAGLAVGASDIAKPLKKLQTSTVTERKMVDYAAISHLDESVQRDVIENAPTAEIHMNPITRALLDVNRGDRKKPERVPMSDKVRGLFENNAALIGTWAARIPLALLGAALVAMLIGWKGAGRSLVLLCHTLGKFWLYALSLTLIGVWLTSRVNLWYSVPNAAWSFPVGAILGCIALMRWIDLNYPVWNATIFTFLAPIGTHLVLRFV